MKKVLSIVLIAIVTMAVVACNEKPIASKNSPLTDSVSMLFGDLYGSSCAAQLKADSTMDMKQVIKGIEAVLRADTSNHSYMAGLQIGMQIMQMYNGVKQQNGIEINQKTFLKHFEAALLNDSTMDQNQMMQMQMALEPLMERATKEAKANDPRALENKNAGEAFLKKKAADKAYTKTASGLLYKVLAQGEGANFTEKDIVMTKYVGKHIDGKEFDSSRGEAIPFDLRMVVPGFAEMIKLMKPGMKVEVIIPAALAYGEDGNSVIGPNETLVFEVETVGIKKADAEDGHQVPAEAHEH